MIRWTEEPVLGKTREAYKFRRGLRCTLWLMFIPVFVRTTWEVTR